MDLSNLTDLANQMQDAYSEGLGAMDEAQKEVVKDMKPDHEIDVDIKLSANIEGHEYEVVSNIVFEIELKPFLDGEFSKQGDLSKALDGLDVDLGDDKDAVMQQLGKPRVIGAVKKIDTKTLKVSNDKGSVDVDLNRDGTLLATIDGDKMSINFESVLSFPDNTDLFVVIPSMEKMQENIVLDIKDLDKKVDFKWIEKDKDGLKVEGSIKVEEI
jgi:hypothetical protein